VDVAEQKSAIFMSFFDLIFIVHLSFVDLLFDCFHCLELEVK
jgi:hypothetical protein